MNIIFLRARLPYFFLLSVINQILGPVSYLRCENRFYLLIRGYKNKFKKDQNGYFLHIWIQNLALFQNMTDRSKKNEAPYTGLDTLFYFISKHR